MDEETKNQINDLRAELATIQAEIAGVRGKYAAGLPASAEKRINDLGAEIARLAELIKAAAAPTAPAAPAAPAPEKKRSASIFTFGFNLDGSNE